MTSQTVNYSKKSVGFFISRNIFFIFVSKS
jgi:hypothetical protein